MGRAKWLQMSLLVTRYIYHTRWKWKLGRVYILIIFQNYCNSCPLAVVDDPYEYYIYDSFISRQMLQKVAVNRDDFGVSDTIKTYHDVHGASAVGVT